MQAHSLPLREEPSALRALGSLSTPSPAASPRPPRRPTSPCPQTCRFPRAEPPTPAKQRRTQTRRCHVRLSRRRAIFIHQQPITAGPRPVLAGREAAPPWARTSGPRVRDPASATASRVHLGEVGTKRGDPPGFLHCPPLLLWMPRGRADRKEQQVMSTAGMLTGISRPPQTGGRGCGVPGTHPGCGDLGLILNRLLLHRYRDKNRQNLNHKVYIFHRSNIQYTKRKRGTARGGGEGQHAEGKSYHSVSESSLCAGPKTTTRALPSAPSPGDPHCPHPRGWCGTAGAGGTAARHLPRGAVLWMASEGSLRRAAVDDPHPQSQARSRGCSEYMGQGRR